ncbi:MAG TPA: VTT domain-containing protein [Vicinamibacterales bacterium]|nr:VTT domain-containing protein [Vicinamibacterales bacterium]
MLTDLFRRLTEGVSQFADQFGGPGLATVAFLDSSLLSLPEVNDALVVLLALQQPEHWWYYASFTTAGSVAGCFALYLVGRRGGEALLRRRFRAEQIERALALFRRWGPFALVIPSMLPPPMPFKIFVLLAGVSGVSPRAFLLSVAFGRGLRYLGQAFLAYRYGAEARAIISANLPAVAVGVAIAMTAAGAGLLLWHRARPA